MIQEFPTQKAYGLEGTQQNATAKVLQWNRVTMIPEFSEPCAAYVPHMFVCRRDLSSTAEANFCKDYH